MYADLSFANDFFDTHLGGTVWGDAEESDKLAALQMAEDMINRQKYRGVKTDPEQAGEFPRKYGGTEETEVSLSVKNAVCEVALYLLLNYSPTSAARRGVKTVRAGDAQETYSDLFVGTERMPSEAQRLLGRYLIGSAPI